EAGVMLALFELGLSEKIKVVSGTSIGTVNALLFCMQDQELIQKSWNCLSYGQFMAKGENFKISTISEFIKKWKDKNVEVDLGDFITEHEVGLISQKGIRDYLNTYVDIKRFRQTDISIYSCAYNIEKEMPIYFKLNDYTEEELIMITLASCAVPFIFSPVIINGEPYADGGVQSPLYQQNNVDNIPSTPLKNHPIDLIIAVHVNYQDKVDHLQFPNTHIIEIYPSTPLELINGTGTVNLNQDVLEQRLELGYKDAIVVLAPIVLASLKGKNIDSYLRQQQENNEKIRSKYNKKPLGFLKTIHSNN
ncbi:MAG: patatin-like phospholipase family protein, partial [Turicibacter sp.]